MVEASITYKDGLINAFPEHMFVALQQLSGINTMEVGDFITQAGVLARQKDYEQGAAAVIGRSNWQQQIANDEELRGVSWQSQGFTCKSFRCQGPHMARECREPRPEVTCYRCEQVGHISKFCPHGNEQGEVTAPVATPLIR